ncbi:MAG: hypothetical protein ACYTXA_29990 [Nostoc sp.]
MILGDRSFDYTIILGDAYGGKLRTLHDTIILCDRTGNSPDVMNP